MEKWNKQHNKKRPPSQVAVANSKALKIYAKFFAANSQLANAHQPPR